MQKNKKISEELKTEMHELHRDFHDLYPLHTPSNEEDRETGFGSVATEEEKADPVKATTEKKKLTPVFLLSLLIVAGLTAACLAWPSQFLAATSQLCDTISTDFGWFYLLLIALIVIVCMVFMISPIGNIHLGNPGFMDRDAVLCRYGYRPCFLGRSRTARPFRDIDSGT